MTKLDARKLLGFRLLASAKPSNESLGLKKGNKPTVPSLGLKKGTKPGAVSLGLKMGRKPVAPASV